MKKDRWIIYINHLEAANKDGFCRVISLLPLRKGRRQIMQYLFNVWELLFNQQLDHEPYPQLIENGNRIVVQFGKFFICAEKAKILDVSVSHEGISSIRWKSYPRTEVEFEGVRIKNVHYVEQTTEEAPMIDLSIYSLWKNGCRFATA